MRGEDFSSPQIRQFRRQILAWFDEHARDLPWRQTRDPYTIWVSEIMLQQTRVNAVMDHYARFLKRFPTIQALAEAEEPETLAIWSGLGYYRRARMLHKAARFVVKELDGVLPRTAAGLRTLPGIGEYTSAAIASIAFGEPVAVVDGNVERVVTRLTGLEQKPDTKASSLIHAIRKTIDQLLDRDRPGDFNQAMMELGATVCLPKGPLCLQCPVERLCRTHGEHATAARKAMSSKQVAFAFLRRNSRKISDEVLLEQRPSEASLMPGMWELPEVNGFDPDSERLLLHIRHSITTTNYYVSILRFEPGEQSSLPKQQVFRKWVKTSELLDLPLTGLTRKVLKRLHVLPGYTPGATPIKLSIDNGNDLTIL